MIMVMARVLPLLLVLWVSTLAAARLVASTSCQDIFSLSVVRNALLGWMDGWMDDITPVALE